MATTGRDNGVVSRLGFEPRTPALKGQCSTIELPAHILEAADSKRLTAPSGRQSGVIRLASVKIRVSCSLWHHHQFSKLLPMAAIFFGGAEQSRTRGKRAPPWEAPTPDHHLGFSRAHALLLRFCLLVLLFLFLLMLLLFCRRLWRWRGHRLLRRRLGRRWGHRPFRRRFGRLGRPRSRLGVVHFRPNRGRRWG